MAVLRRPRGRLDEEKVGLWTSTGAPAKPWEGPKRYGTFSFALGFFSSAMVEVEAAMRVKKRTVAPAACFAIIEISAVDTP